jgi:hypothetical protein
MTSQPAQPNIDGANRTAGGRFGPGNKAAAGRGPSQYATFRTEAQKTLTDVFDQPTWRQVLEQAKARLTSAATKDSDFTKLLEWITHRVLGDRTHDPEAEERIAALERALEEKQTPKGAAAFPRLGA